MATAMARVGLAGAVISSSGEVVVDGIRGMPGVHRVDNMVGLTSENLTNFFERFAIFKLVAEYENRLHLRGNWAFSFSSKTFLCNAKLRDHKRSLTQLFEF